MSTPVESRRRHKRHPVEPPPNRRRLAWLVGLALLAAAAAALYLLRPRPKPPAREEATGVRSTLTQQGDSLRVAVTWSLTAAPAGERAESVRVEVGLGQGDQSHAAMLAARRLADTAYVPAPAAGRSTTGYSCVAAQHRGRLSTEACTPWQYVRPAAEAGPPPAGRAARPTTGRARAAAVPAAQIVVQPSGLQVDPDVGGKCAAWQRQNPGRPVWVAVNRTAVPACTGPNGRPVIAQFCAFAVLPDGRRTKTANVAGNAYCEELFEAWARQRYS